MSSGLILYARIESLFMQVYPTFKNYPKAEKHGLCLQIKHCFVQLLEHAAVAQEVPSERKPALKRARAKLHNLITLYRLSRSERYISKGFFEQVDLKVTEIRKILAGLMRSSGKPRQSP